MRWTSKDTGAAQTCGQQPHNTQCATPSALLTDHKANHEGLPDNKHSYALRCDQDTAVYSTTARPATVQPHVH